MFSVAGAVARLIAPFLTFVAVAGMGFLADPAPVDRAPVVRLADDANPLAGMPFYVNPTSAAMRAAQHADPPSPELTAVANTPQAYWIVPGSSASTVAKYAGDAAAAGALPVFTVYGIPHRDCGSFAAGGLAIRRRLPRVDRRHRIPDWRFTGGGRGRTRRPRHG